MKMKSLTLVAALLISAPAFAANYSQAPGSMLAFATKYQGQTFTGRFGGFDTRLTLDPAKLASAKLQVSINMRTASTNDKDRDGYLNGADFFDPSKFATATYVSNDIKSAGPNQYIANGTLTLRGVSKPVQLKFSLNPNAQGAQLTGSALIKRLDFGVGGSKDWRDVSVIPNEVAVSTRVNLKKVP